MISVKKIILGISIIAFSNNLSAQSAVNQNEPTHISETSKMYSYQFSGKLTPTEIATLKEEVSKMLFVKEVKMEYKSEKSAGQIRLITLEKFTNNDAPFQFSIFDLKELLIKNNLMPVDYTYVVLSTK